MEFLQEVIGPDTSACTLWQNLASNVLQQQICFLLVQVSGRSPVVKLFAQFNSNTPHVLFHSNFVWFGIFLTKIGEQRRFLSCPCHQWTVPWYCNHQPWRTTPSHQFSFLFYFPLASSWYQSPSQWGIFSWQTHQTSHTTQRIKQAFCASQLQIMCLLHHVNIECDFLLVLHRCLEYCIRLRNGITTCHHFTIVEKKPINYSCGHHHVVAITLSMLQQMLVWETCN